MRDQGDFLRDVAHGLPFDEAERTEILEELQAHVIDSTAELEAEGRLPPSPSGRRGTARPARSTREGPDRGSPESSSAARCRGLGFVGLVTSGFSAILVGVLLSALAFIAVLVAAQVIGPWIGWTGLGTSSHGLDAVSIIGSPAVRPVRGGQRHRACCRRRLEPGYPVNHVRQVLAPIGASLLAVYALVGWSGPLDLVGVVTLLTLPAWWALGTWRMSPVGRGSARTFAGLFLVGSRRSS